MDGMVLGLFLLATFLGGVTSGLAGFAMGLVVSGIWLHILTPIQTAILIVGYGFVTQGYGIWKRSALAELADCCAVHHRRRGRRAGGTLLLTYIDPALLRIGVGALLVLYSVYSLARPAIQAGATAASLPTSASEFSTACSAA